MDERNQQTERVTRRAQQNAANASGGQHVQEFGAAKMREPSYMRAKDERQQQPVQDESKDPVVFESLDQIFQVIEKIDEIIQGGKRIPLSKSLVIVDAGEINDLLGQLRLGFPRTVKEAKQIIAQQDQILDDAHTAATQSKESANKYYLDAKESADRYGSEKRTEADKYDRELRALANQDANNLIADAQTRAEQIMLDAQKRQSDMVNENEIVRRANAFAMEIRDTAQKESDRVYSQACMQSDKILSGATAALSKAANDLAQLRDALLNPNAGQMNGYNGPM
jgi:hypothetical protein